MGLAGQITAMQTYYILLSFMIVSVSQNNICLGVALLPWSSTRMLHDRLRALSCILRMYTSNSGGLPDDQCMGACTVLRMRE